MEYQAAWVAGKYAHINFSDQKNFREIFHHIISGMRDPDLPVRVNSVFALQPFIEACQGMQMLAYKSIYWCFLDISHEVTQNYVLNTDLNEIRPFIPQLLDGM